LARETWLLTPAEDEREGEIGLDVPLLGGVPYAEAGDSWPAEPATGEPMQFVLQFLAETVLHVVFIHAFTLVETGPHLVDGKGGVLVRRYEEPRLEPRTALSVPEGMRRAPIYARIDRVLGFPSWEENDDAAITELCLKARPDEPWEAYASATRALGEPEPDINAAKLFGYQLPLQGAIKYDCPDCDERMEFLAQVYVSEGADLNLYLFRCARHRSRIAGVAQFT